MAHTEAGSVIAPLEARPLKNTLCLFDVDGTLTPARLSVSPAMLSLLSQLRHKCAIGFVGGSNLIKQQEQLGTPSIDVTSLFDFCFAENGLTAYRMGVPLQGQSFVGWLGEERYKKLVNFVLRYLSEIDLPVKRGTFVEFRFVLFPIPPLRGACLPFACPPPSPSHCFTPPRYFKNTERKSRAGMINISPIGRNASTAERNAYETYDKLHSIRSTFVRTLQREFPDYGLTYSIGGQISFDVFPTGWDKTYCLRHVEHEKEVSGVEYTTIHFFGDKAFPGGNDWEIYEDPRTVGHKVGSPEETMGVLKELFQL